MFFLFAFGVVCQLFVAGNATAAPTVLDQILEGRFSDAHFHPGELHEAIVRGDLPEPVIERDTNGWLRNLELPVPIVLRGSTASYHGGSPIEYLDLLRNEMGLSESMSLLNTSRARSIGGDLIEHTFRQFVAQLPVLNSRITVILDADGGLRRVGGRFLQDSLAADVPNTPYSYWELLASAPSNAIGSVVAVGVFHGSLFGLRSWSNRSPTLAFATTRKDAAAGHVREYVDWATGETLHQIRLAADTLPPVDIYHDVDCILGSPHFELDAPVRKESNSTCGVGTFPNCTWWPGDSQKLNEDVHELASYLDSDFGRYSWDDGQTPECDPNNPAVDPDQCCERNNPSTMVAASDWLSDNWVEQLCCVTKGVFCPGEVFSIPVENSMFNFINCVTAFAHGTSCTDVVGHEFTHGIDFSEKQLARCQANDSNGLYCRHEEPMSEAFPDVLGEAFQQIRFPGGSTPWALNDGEPYCTPVRNLSSPQGADHASTVDWYNTSAAERKYLNSGALSKGFHLLGRPPSDGSQVHYGVSVTGIGVSDAAKIYYSALTNGLPDTVDRSFSNLRNALMAAAGSLFGYSSSQYYATRNTVNAMGYWTTTTTFPQSLDAPPGLGLYGDVGSNLSRNRTVVYRDGTSLNYRSRYFSLSGYKWTTPVTITTTTNPYFDVFTEVRRYQGIPIGYHLHVYYLTSSNQLRHFKIDNSGTTSDAPVLMNGIALTVQTGSRIRVVQSSGYKLFYVPSTGSSYVKYADLDTYSNIASNVLQSTIPSSAASYDVDYQGGRFHGFWIEANQLRAVMSSGTTWFQNVYHQWLNTTAFAVQTYGSRLHLITKNTQKGWVYQTCFNECDDYDEWLEPQPIDPAPDADSTWAVMARYFAEDFGLSLAMQKSGGNMFYRTKYSD